MNVAAAGALTISLVDGDFPEPNAVRVKGPGNCLASYPCSGKTTLTS